MAVISKSFFRHSARKMPRGGIHVGITVEFDMGLSKMKGVVVEDRGRIGAGGRHLFRVAFPKNGHSSASALDRFIELPEADLHVIRHG